MHEVCFEVVERAVLDQKLSKNTAYSFSKRKTCSKILIGQQMSECVIVNFKTFEWRIPSVNLFIFLTHHPTLNQLIRSLWRSLNSGV